MEEKINAPSVITEKKVSFTALEQLGFFMLFWLIAFLFYSQTGTSRFLDYLDNWAFAYDEYEWSGFKSAYQVVSVHYVYHFFTYTLYRFFGFNIWIWTAVFTFFHALNAFLIWKIASVILEKSKRGRSWRISIAAALIFLVSPYQTEVVAWGPTIHYLICCGLLLLSVLLLIRYTETNALKTFIIILALFTVAWFTHEIAIVFPVIAFVVMCYKKWHREFLRVARVVGVLILFGFLFFVFNRLILGQWIGHYGAETHLNFSLAQLGSAWLKYLLKYLFLLDAEIFSSISSSIYKFSDTPLAGWFFLIAVFVFGVVFIYRTYSDTTVVRAWMMFLLLFFVAVVPVFNLYFPTWINIQGDRLGYLASAFFSLFAAFLILSFSRQLRYPLFFALFISEISFLQTNIQSWRKASIVSESLEQNFNQFEAKKIYMLAVPDNFRGAYMYRLTGLQPLAENIEKRHGVNMQDKFVEVTKFNMLTAEDKVMVEVINDFSLKVTLEKWENLFLKNSQGASDFETEEFKVELDEWGHSYTITFKQKETNAVYMYASGMEWKTVEGF